MSRLLRHELPPFLALTGLFVALLVGGAAYAGRDLALAGAVAVSAVAAGTARAVGHVRVPVPAVPPRAGVHDTGVRPFQRLIRMRQRVDWGGRSPENFRVAVLPVLAELADDRLRRGHGVHRERDPQAARRLLGDDLADLLAGEATLTEAPPLARLDDYIRRIEAL